MNWLNTKPTSIRSNAKLIDIKGWIQYWKCATLGVKFIFWISERENRALKNLIAYFSLGFINSVVRELEYLKVVSSRCKIIGLWKNYGHVNTLLQNEKIFSFAQHVTFIIKILGFLLKCFPRHGCSRLMYTSDGSVPKWCASHDDIITLIG